LAPGQGVLMQEAVRRGVRVRGVDSDESVAEHCRHNGLDVVRADGLEYLDSCNDTYDAVVALHLIEHLDTRQADRLFKSARRICRPGGKLVLATPNYADPMVAGELFWLDPTHVRPYPLRLLELLGRRNGWRLVGSGFEPVRHRRKLPHVLVNRVRLGRNYGRSSIWAVMT
jgi:O-antigen chain-terminating methyltransferase